jgi:putative transposase
MIVHTDRGSQCLSNRFRAPLKGSGCQLSMSGRGNCWDNAQAENCFSRYKAEPLERGLFEDISQARSENFSYGEGYYRVGRHSVLSY